jgi:3-oxoadipate enol-lactonase
MDFASRNGNTIHYEWMNNGKDRTLLFINSLGTDLRIWDDVAGMLKDQANILRFDNRGHGLSSTVEPTEGLGDFVDDTFFLVDSLSIKRCVVVGLSIGGMIAQVMAVKRPALVEKLILCDTRFKIGTPQFWNDRIAAVSAGNLSGISEGVMLRWFSETFVKNYPHKVAGYRTMLERISPTGYIRACEALRDADLTEVAKAISVPTLCVVGIEDKSTTPEEVRSLSELIRGSRYEVIKDSAHIPCIDNPAVLTKLIKDFIQ